jgi:ferredoxin
MYFHHITSLPLVNVSTSDKIIVMPKITIDSQKCIGCNTCPLISPKTFALDQTTFKAIVVTQPTVLSQEDKDAISSCPVDAIKVED